MRTLLNGALVLVVLLTALALLVSLLVWTLDLSPEWAFGVILGIIGFLGICYVLGLAVEELKEDQEAAP